jgi:hypothetical protein
MSFRRSLLRLAMPVVRDQRIRAPTDKHTARIVALKVILWANLRGRLPVDENWQPCPGSGWWE